MKDPTELLRNVRPFPIPARGFRIEAREPPPPCGMWCPRSPVPPAEARQHESCLATAGGGCGHLNR